MEGARDTTRASGVGLLNSWRLNPPAFARASKISSSFKQDRLPTGSPRPVASESGCSRRVAAQNLGTVRDGSSVPWQQMLSQMRMRRRADPSGNPAHPASGPPWLVSGFRFCARLGFSIPSSFSGPRDIIPAFGYGAPHFERQRDFNPPEQRAAQRTLQRRSDPLRCSDTPRWHGCVCRNNRPLAAVATVAVSLGYLDRNMTKKRSVHSMRWPRIGRVLRLLPHLASLLSWIILYNV